VAAFGWDRRFRNQKFTDVKAAKSATHLSVESERRQNGGERQGVIHITIIRAVK
jgi:hypothetical protein